MKDKPISHKNQNTFRFLTFSERISKINIDVVHRISKTSFHHEEGNNFFQEALEKWTDLNYSQDYGDLQKEVGHEIRLVSNDVTDFNQIVFKQNEIIEILLKYLKKEESLALDAVLELIVALARDLQSDFYPHFPKFFSAIVSQLSTKDTELLEKLFTCLAYLFKFLWKYMIKDIENVYRLFSTLLSNDSKEHIQIFAVESFAFLIRKVKDRKKLFAFIFEELDKNPKQSSGVGHLFFEVIKGVKEQFHSCTKDVLKLLLEFLGNSNCSCDLIEDTLHHTVIAIAKHTTKKYALIIQSIFCSAIEKLINNTEEFDDNTSQHLNHVLNLFSLWMSFKDGKLISSDDNTVQVIIELSGKRYLPLNVLKTIAELIAKPIVTNCLSFSVEIINTLVSNVYLQVPEVFIHFTRKVLKYGMFEKDILPNLISACIEQIKVENNSKKTVLQILAESVVYLKPIPETEDDIKSFSKLYFCLPNKDILKNSTSDLSVLEDALLDTLSPEKISISELPNIWAALVCLTHMRCHSTKVPDSLQELALKLHECLLSPNSVTYRGNEEYAFILHHVYFAYLISCKDQEEDIFNAEFFFKLLKKHPKSANILRLVDIYLSRNKKTVLVDSVFEVLPDIIPNLSSPFHLIRLFTLRVLTVISPCLVENQDLSVFNICLEAEKVPLDVQSYREKIKWLRKLEFTFLEKQFSGKYEDYLKQTPVYYVIGVLFINFRLLWEPAIDIIQTHANENTKVFMEIYGNHLQEISNMCENSNFQFEELFEVDSAENENSVYFHWFHQFCKFSENPDVGNHRILLWKAMEKFPDVVEPKNKIIVPLIFKFMANEITKIDSSMAKKESLSKKISAGNIHNSCVETIEEFEDDFTHKKRKTKEAPEKSKKRKCNSSIHDVEDKLSIPKDGDDSEAPITVEENEDDIETESEDDSVEDEFNEQLESLSSKAVSKVIKNSTSWTKRKYSISKSLAAYLSVFAKFKNPKALYRTDELQKLYNELLSYHDPLIQKLSFDCIMTYNFKYLRSYKENFYRILDNKTFKSEVVLFSLDKQNAVIEEDDRINVLAILMRILYGKMLHKTGNNTTGKSQANTRRSLVLRFLAGCSAEELQMFFDLVFLPFKDLLKDDTLVAVKKIRESLDMSSIVPLRRQHSALNTLGLIFEHLGNLVPELLSWLLKVLLVIAAASTTLLEKRDEVLPHCVNLLKSLRTLAMMRIIQFFKIFPKYDFHSEEVDAMFESVIWPLLSRLELESVNQPSPLLRLLSTWSENPRYFILFSNKHETCPLLSPLPHLFALYVSSKTKPRVIGVISKIIFQLLTTEDNINEDEEKISPIKLNCLPPEMKDNEGTMNFGTRLLLPFIPRILQRLEITILALGKRKSKKMLSSRDLTILLRISSYIEDSEQCSKLISLLIPFLHKSKVDAESEVLILSTTSSLIKKTKNPESFMKEFAPLFGKLTNQNSRLALTNVFTTMAEQKESLSVMAVVINKMNAYDSKMFEEPDYQKRLDGHREAIEIIRAMEGNEINRQFIKIIILNSTFVIRMIDDMALRNSSSHLLVELTKIIASWRFTENEIFNMLIFDTLLPEIHKGLKCTAEIKRHEFIFVLSAVLQYCNDHPRLKELVALSHDDKDLDFWENIRHLQVHRRARALLRFSDALKEQRESKENVNVHYLLLYMIPIVQAFLFDDAYKKHVHVIDAAIETLGSIANCLPWHHYELLLKQYLQLLSKNMDHHKTIIKIIVSLLDAFPYNLKTFEKSAGTTRESILLEESTKKDFADTPDKGIECSDLNGASADVSELTPENCIKITKSIRKNILPLLHQSLMKKSKHDDEHKLAGHYYPEDDEILRVPIALAMVKLLQKLPSGTLEKALPGLFLKMCELLKSRTESIRQTTRETLIKMMQSLGPKYFYFLLTEMKGVMKKGYQVHVMTFTLNAVLTNISDQFTCGDLDDCLKNLSEICQNELFTDVAEEKEVSKITGKVKEARSSKSYSIYQIVSKHISETLLLDLIQPLKEVLLTKHSHKSLGKISECLRNIALGLCENQGVSDKGLLVFIHAIVNESIPGIIQKKSKVNAKDSKYERPDIYLLPKEPGRSGPPAKVAEKTNVHILVEFGLQILQFSLRKHKISKEQQDILEMLDPFVSLLSQCLTSNHVKIISTALRCLLPFYKYPLPSFKQCTKKIVDSLFILINKYASPGMGRGQNFEMIVMCFKMLTLLVKDTNYHKFSEDQLHSLLSYIEQDIYDCTRQATAFSLLKAVLSKKLDSPELPGIMSKVAEMSIVSEQENVRAQCRQLCMQYMLDYPLGKKLIKSISFFIAQLEYPYEYGRVSCFEIINSMMNMFPVDILKRHAALFLLPIAARLVNDESAICRKMSAECIKKLLEKTDHECRSGLFSVAFNWLQAKKMSHKRLGAQVCGIFAEVEGEQFEHRLLQVLPIYSELLSNAVETEVEKETDERCMDHFLYHILNSLTKMLKFECSKNEECCKNVECSAKTKKSTQALKNAEIPKFHPSPVIKKPEYSGIFNEFWEQLQRTVLYPHMWVRLAVSQLFGLLLSSYEIDEIIQAILTEDTDIYLNTRQKLRDLSADFSTQIQSLHVNETLGDQAVENLVYLARVISALPETSDSGEEVQVTLSWMIRRMCREAKKEVAETPNISLKRKFVFMFMEKTTEQLGKEKMIPYLNLVLIPLCREIADSSKNADEVLKRCAQKALDEIKRVVGVEEFSNHYSMVQSALVKKKTKRKREKAQEAITDPERYSKRKIKKQQSKKESKKRKILQQKGKRKAKKPKLADLVIAS